jgi:hypothetical protein
MNSGTGDISTGRMERKGMMAGDVLGSSLMAENFAEGISQTRYLVTELYRKALMLGSAHRLWSGLTRRSNRLHNLSEDHLLVGSSHYAGVREVCISSIRGSENRDGDFDDQFYPLNENTRQRWQNIAKAYSMGIGLPPVQLIQVGEAYFVRDGHHRISVARAFGFKTIEAEITVWNVERQM